MCKFLAVNCTKMRLAAGLHPDPLGELWRSSRSPSRYSGGKKGRERKRLEIGKEGTGLGLGRDVKE